MTPLPLQISSEWYRGATVRSLLSSQVVEEPGVAAVGAG